MTNPSGVNPLEYNVIVQPIEPEEVRRLANSGLVAPDQFTDRATNSATKGVVIDVSPLAFSYEEWPTGTVIPSVGDLVFIKKFSGGEFQGADGQRYWFVKDKDVMGLAQPGAFADEEAA